MVVTLELTNLGTESFALNNWNVELRDSKHYLQPGGLRLLEVLTG